MSGVFNYILQLFANWFLILLGFRVDVPSDYDTVNFLILFNVRYCVYRNLKLPAKLIKPKNRCPSTLRQSFFFF